MRGHELLGVGVFCRGWFSWNLKKVVFTATRIRSLLAHGHWNLIDIIFYIFHGVKYKCGSYEYEATEKGYLRAHMKSMHS